jgi:hypothetical protein
LSLEELSDEAAGGGSTDPEFLPERMLTFVNDDINAPGAACPVPTLVVARDNGEATQICWPQISQYSLLVTTGGTTWLRRSMARSPISTAGHYDRLSGFFGRRRVKGDCLFQRHYAST